MDPLIQLLENASPPRGGTLEEVLKIGIIVSCQSDRAQVFTSVAPGCSHGQLWPACVCSVLRLPVWWAGRLLPTCHVTVIRPKLRS